MSTTNERLRAAWRMLIMAAGLGLAACGGGGASPDGEQGDVLIGLTDAEGDFLTYSVDVTAIRLTHANGRQIETLPVSSRIDFAQYVELTEFVTAASVPLGRYRAASLVLDFSAADIQVEDAAGAAVPVAAILDSDGNALSTLEVSVDFDDSRPLVVSRGLPAMINLDFDLQASNQVAFDIAGPILTVAPLLVADLQLDAPKLHRVRGALESVTPAESSFELVLRPLHHDLGRRDRLFGQIDVRVDDSTHYEIDGVTYTGAPGLLALSALPQFSAVVALGEPKVALGRFEAREVRAGSSVAGGERDAVTGTVSARSGDTLSLTAVAIERADGSVSFVDALTLTLDPATTQVLKQLSTDSHGTDEISVGQRLAAFGDLTGDASTGLSLDVGDGLVRMLLTKVRGQIVEAAAPLSLALESLGGLAPTTLDFAGTGSDAANDADSSAYEVITGPLSLSGLAPAEQIKVEGFPVAFGQAQNGVGDFTARTLVRVGQAPARMSVSWESAATAPIVIDAGRLLLDLDQVGRFHQVSRRGVVTDLKALASPPVVAAAQDRGVFLLQGRNGTRQHKRFDDFLVDLDARLAAGAQVRLLQAKGQFVDTTATLTADWIKIRLQ